MSDGSKLRASAIAEAFEALYGATAKSRRSDLLKRTESETYPESLRVNMSRTEKSNSPHTWRRVDPKSKGKLGVARWTCTKCGGWVDFSAGIKPNGHSVPTCAQLLVDQVHDA